MNNFSRGSEWRKWDLHFHTPSSYDYKNNSVTDEDIIKKLKDNHVSVVAITDHHIIDTERIKNLQLLGLNENITVLPGIEFLSDARGSDPIHIIGIFSESSDIEYVWGQIENRTSISKIRGESKKRDEIYCVLNTTIDLVHELGGIITIHAGQKSNSIETITNSLKHACAQKTDIAKAVDIYELGSSSDQAGYLNVVFPYIKKRLPMIICSDNHDINNYHSKDTLWIKADPTFDGLKQVLNEPETRVFIGEIPELFLRINHKRTKYIKNIKINSVETYSDKQGQWFKNIDIPINSELVSIIGNKGSGKSALADIIALCGNYKDHDSFSFLHKERFKKEKLAENFRATLLWESEDRLTKNLQETNSNTEVEIVKYIPQKKFENLTNEIKSVEAFQKEIEKVVFAHFDDSEKMKLETFQDYIDSHKKTIELEIDMLVGELKKINDRVISLENMQTKEYRAGIEKRLELKQKDYDALIPPVAVIDPNSDPAKKIVNGAKLREIDDLAHSIELLEQNLSNIRLEKNNHLVDIQQLGNFKKEVEIKVQELDKLLENKKDILESFDLNISDIVSLNIDYSKLDTIMTVKKLLISNIDKQLSVNEGDSSIANQIIIQKNELQNIRAALNSEQIQYQNYLIQKKEWEDNRKLIMGDNETPDTIMYLKDTISYLDEKLANELKEEFKKRILKTREIFKNKNEIIKLYKKIKEKVDTVIEENRDVLQSYGINIDASFVPQNTFQSKFFSFINQKRAGTFYTVEGSIENLNTLCDEIDFNNENSIILFLENIIKAFNVDLKKDVEHFIGDQVNDRAGLYKYLFSLDFLDYNYQLKQGGKQLQQLSPGERGALLLVFYLLLDKSDIPLMIDQPEDNLDNQSVAKVLVPFIKKAKKKRQIIMVTHNPNLAVVADSEQVIYVNIEKENNNKFAVISGSIENKEINEKIVQVLEGTMPAFNKRKEKYYYE